jgi:hypothetical protein
MGGTVGGPVIWVVSIAIAIFTVYAFRAAWREQALVRALLLEVTWEGKVVGWPEFQKRTGLGRGFRGPFVIAAHYLVRRRFLEAVTDGDIIRFRRATRVEELRPEE